MGFRKDEEKAFQIASDEEIFWATLEDRRTTDRDELLEKMKKLREAHPEVNGESSPQVIEGQKLLDKISNYHNSNAPRAIYPKEPKPKGRRGNKSIYVNPHKKRSSAGWRERLAASFSAKAAQDAFFIDETTPMDIEGNPSD